MTGDEVGGNTWLLPKELVGEDERSGVRRTLTKFPRPALGGTAVLLQRSRHLCVVLDSTAALLERRNSRLLHLAHGGTATSRRLSGGTVITRCYTCLVLRIDNCNIKNFLPLDGGFFKRTPLGADDTLVPGVGIFELGRTLETEDLTVTGRLTESTVISAFGVVNLMGAPAAFEPTGADGSAGVSVS